MEKTPAQTHTTTIPPPQRERCAVDERTAPLALAATTLAVKALLVVDIIVAIKAMLDLAIAWAMAI
jgi:hypothetical protein